MSPAEASVKLKEQYGYELCPRTIARLCDEQKITHLLVNNRVRQISDRALAAFVKKREKPAL